MGDAIAYLEYLPYTIALAQRFRNFFHSRSSPAKQTNQTTSECYEIYRLRNFNNQWILNEQLHKYTFHLQTNRSDI